MFSYIFLQDAWLDSVDTYQKHDGKSSTTVTRDDKPRDLTTEELAGINRRIADVLEPGETVCCNNIPFILCLPNGLQRASDSLDTQLVSIGNYISVFWFILETEYFDI